MTFPSPTIPTRIGIVAIGRNEGERLMRCLRSLDGSGAAVVYVDSASTDGSAERARALGATVVDLDLTLPFTAARARNAGLALARGEFVSFPGSHVRLPAGSLAARVRARE